MKKQTYIKPEVVVLAVSTVSLLRQESFSGGHNSASDEQTLSITSRESFEEEETIDARW